MKQPATVTRLLETWARGERSALDRLTPLVYGELRRLAAGYIRRERQGHTLQPTALVHEAYMKLAHNKQATCQNRGHFFAIAANLMRQILVNHALRRQRAKRGGGDFKVSLQDAEGVSQESDVNIAALNAALTRLAAIDPRQSRIVEMRFFGGLTNEEVAQELGLSVVTIKREWRIAKAWLRSAIDNNDA
jgi:RNA polymerase sigma factor (TIGR02999 family)